MYGGVGSLGSLASCVAKAVSMPDGVHAAYAVAGVMRWHGKYCLGVAS